MKPRDLLLLNVVEYVEPQLETIGFRFSSRGIAFKRASSIGNQEISFSLSKWDSEDDCDFWTMWSATSLKYKKWYQKEWGRTPANIALGGDCDWNLPGWPRAVADHFHLSNHSNDESEMAMLMDAIINIGIPYLDSISDWEGAAHHLVQQSLLFSKAADFLMISGKMAAAEEVLLSGLSVYQSEGKVDQLGELAEIQIRLKRYF
ncbi:hypothetical protein GCM10011352_26640 [Marinobacterium zhoushanense]|uniref:DUF4304 domain-containing protein n=1 Tax=Marinobacterium zhoushanense TaxID=1679163 RepID=A0ABQ1KHC2_9GAMM|nr:hypothetical protein [Marinobacterium zhoushanense]GGB99146.1 hypothetical protein GCM10011352_26640 [Marinobacterium zhoushanense]